LIKYLEDKMHNSEKKIREAAMPLLKSHRTYIDIGAAAGDTAHPFVNEFKTVICFEPNPKQAQLISSECKVHQFALADYEGTADLMMPPGKDNLEYASIDAKRIKRWDKPNAIQRVKVKKLDQFVFDDVDFIKIDVEQGEMAVILGGEHTIRKHRPLIMFENKRNENRPTAEVLRSWGYEIKTYKTELLALWPTR